MFLLIKPNSRSSFIVVRASFAGDLQSVSWLAMAFGGICGSLLGGYALNSLQISTNFLLFSILPTMQLLSCGLVEESSKGTKVLHDPSDSSGADVVNGYSNISDEDSLAMKKSRNTTKRRKKRKKNRVRTHASTNSHLQEKGGPLVVKWFHSLKDATYSLCRAFRQPIILRYVIERLY